MHSGLADAPHKNAIVDLRSDTVTRPTPAMRAAMAAAEVGDDVYGEDPHGKSPAGRAAEIFQREAALFVPSGCMGNLLAIMGWTQRSNEVICEQRAHVNLYELASMSAIAGVMPRTVPAPSGILTWELIEPLIREKIYYDSQTALVTLENTHNMHGGTVYPTAVAEDICERAHAAGLRVHLDGARIFNAAVALGKSVAEITRKFDSIMFCLSKGLGAPVGSMLRGLARIHQAGAHPQKNARRRNAPGGSARRGWTHRAGRISEAPRARSRKRATPGERPLRDERNRPRSRASGNQHRDLRRARYRPHRRGDLRATRDRRMFCVGPTDKYSVRMVTHCDVDRAGIDTALAAVAQVLAEKAPAAAAR